MQFLCRADRIQDFYGLQAALDEAFASMPEYVLGDLLLEAFHEVVNLGVYIQIKRTAEAHILFAAHHTAAGEGLPSPMAACLAWLTGQQVQDLHALCEPVLALEWRAEAGQGFMIDGVWDHVVIHRAQPLGYRWGETPTPPWHVLQQLAEYIYSMAPQNSCGWLLGASRD